MEVKEMKNVPSGEEQIYSEKLKTKPTNQYDPSKKYRWEPSTSFLLSGEEFGLILNSLRATLNSPDAQRILLAERANLAVENSLARAVQIGSVVEDDSVPQKK